MNKNGAACCQMWKFRLQQVTGSRTTLAFRQAEPPSSVVPKLSDTYISAVQRCYSIPLLFVNVLGIPVQALIKLKTVLFLHPPH